MGNIENLTPYNFTSDQSREEAAKNGQKGGVASGAARRRNRTLRQIAEALAEKKITMPTPTGGTEDVTYDVAVVQRQYQKAIIDGDVSAAKYIADLLGEMVQKVDLTSQSAVVILKDSEAAALEKLSK